MTAKLGEWFSAGLRDWDISRDEPYFGFEIPGETGKYFYVWLDAPIGYLGSLLNYCRRTGADFDRYWKPDSDAEVYHFIGKDIVYFHTLFWPAVLHGAGYRPPTSVYAHGFLTVNGQKMSKSRGTFITARAWLDHLPAEYLRYYYAARLGPGVDDLDLSLDDFVAKVNSDVVGKLVNIASRCAGFIARGSQGRLADRLPEPALYEEFAEARERIGAAYEARDFAAVVREVMQLTDRANLYIDQRKPWLMAKDPAQAGDVQGVCTQGLNLFRALVVYLKPIMPRLAAGAERFLGLAPQQWDDVAQPLLGTTIGTYEPLATRVDPAATKALVDASAENLKPSGMPTAAGTAPTAVAAKAPGRRGRTRRRRACPASRSTTSGASTCASRASRPPSWWKARTSSSSSPWTSAASAAPCSRASARRTLPSNWSAGSRSSSRTSSRARCASACPKAWCSRRDRAERTSSCCLPTRAPSPA